MSQSLRQAEHRSDCNPPPPTAPHRQRRAENSSARASRGRYWEGSSSPTPAAPIPKQSSLNMDSFGCTSQLVYNTCVCGCSLFRRTLWELLNWVRVSQSYPEAHSPGSTKPHQRSTDEASPWKRVTTSLHPYFSPVELEILMSLVVKQKKQQFCSSKGAAGNGRSGQGARINWRKKN